MKRSTLFAAVVLLGGTVLQALLWSRQWVYGDQYALFLSGLDLLETGRLPPVAKYMSGGGHIPGSLLPLLIAGPLEAWTDYRAPALLIGVGHLAAAGVLAATVGRALGISFLAAYLAVYWLSPWRLYHAGFVWEPAYVFLPAALHLACAWRLRAGPHFGWSLLLGATLTATLQLHASFVVLVVLTALLAGRRAIRIDWRGTVAGVASGALTLIPTAQAWLAGTLPRMTPGETEDFSRFAVGGLNALKVLAYWLRMGAPDIGRRLRESSYTDAEIVESGIRTGLASGLLTLLVTLSILSVIVAVLASRDYFGAGWASRAGSALRAGWAFRAGSRLRAGWPFRVPRCDVRLRRRLARPRSGLARRHRAARGVPAGGGLAAGGVRGRVGAPARGRGVVRAPAGGRGARAGLRAPDVSAALGRAPPRPGPAGGRPGHHPRFRALIAARPRGWRLSSHVSIPPRPPRTRSAPRSRPSAPSINPPPGGRRRRARYRCWAAARASRRGGRWS